MRFEIDDGSVRKVRKERKRTSQVRPASSSEPLYPTSHQASTSPPSYTPPQHLPARPPRAALRVLGRAACPCRRRRIGKSSCLVQNQVSISSERRKKREEEYVLSGENENEAGCATR